MMDRGNKKWTSIILPEHRKLLREFYEEQTFVQKPEIDPQTYEEWDMLLKMAIKEKCETSLEIYESGIVESVTAAFIDTYDAMTHSIQFRTVDGHIKRLNLSDICGIKII